MRGIADSLLDKGKYEDAYYLYNEIYGQVWSVIGRIQNGLNDFSQSCLNNNFRSSLEFKSSYTIKAAEGLFKKWFDLDITQTLNEMTFTTYGHLKCVCYSPYLNTTISAANIYYEFLVLHALILETESDKWVSSVSRIVTPLIEGGYLKKLRPNLTENTLKKNLIENAAKLKSTDWNNLNYTLMDYLSNIGDKTSELYSNVYKIAGFHFNQKKRRDNTKEKESNQDENYERYERYENFEKHAFNREEEFDPAKATEFEKAKYYGKVLGLSGNVTKSQVRKNYLALIAKYHPDKVFDLGEELIILAEKKTKQLNLAYEWIKKKHGI